MSRDILVNITGNSVARSCQVPEHVLPARVNQHVAIIRPNPELLDPIFLRYWLIHPETQGHLLALASAGATRDALTKGMLEELTIDAPPIAEQRRVAGILSTLDARIDLNHRMNRSLTALSRRLFDAALVGELPADPALPPTPLTPNVQRH